MQVGGFVIIQGIEGKWIQSEEKRIALVHVVLGFRALVIYVRGFFGLHGGEHGEVLFTGFVVRGIDQQYPGDVLNGRVHRGGIPLAGVWVFFAKRQVEIQVAHGVKLNFKFIVIKGHVFALKQRISRKKAAAEAHIPVFEQGHLAVLGYNGHVLAGAEFQSFHVINQRLFAF